MRIDSARAVLLLSALALGACSAGLGPAGSYLVNDPHVVSAGVKVTALTDMSLARGPAIASGVEAQVEGRVDGHHDAFGQFRLLMPVGLMRLPRPEQFFIGYEALLTPGIARTYVGGRAELRPAIGVELGLPLRLAGHEPIWRSDDLLGLGVYLVPSVSALWFETDTLSISAAISLRVTVWSALTP
jgi:hypothetical protein